jgi:GntR family transcriptional repressor for pyruvate dehydrogenase complex
VGLWLDIERKRDMTGVSLRPIDRTSVVQAISEQIFSLVRSGELTPGDRLPTEGEMVRTFGVSRASVRESLRALEALGLIETKVGSGSFVAVIGPKSLVNDELLSLILTTVELKEIFDFRRLLEGETATLAALNATDEDLVAMEQTLDQVERNLQRGQPVFELSWEFHSVLAEASGNGIMAKVLGVVYEMIKEIEGQIYDAHFDMEQETAAHRALLEALKNRNPELAKRRMLEHLTETEYVISQALRV